MPSKAYLHENEVSYCELESQFIMLFFADAEVCNEKAYSVTLVPPSSIGGSILTCKTSSFITARSTETGGLGALVDAVAA